MGLDIYIFLKAYNAPFSLQMGVLQCSSDTNYQV